MTSAQLAVLKANILADPALSIIPGTADGAVAIALAYDQTAVPDFWVWKTRITKAELTNETSVDVTTFNWTGAGFITRTQGERDAWRELFSADGTVNASLPQVRQAFADIFSGATAPAPANRTHLLAVARRKARRGERLFATGTGSVAVPGTLVFEGGVTMSDVLQSLAV